MSDGSFAPPHDLLIGGLWRSAKQRFEVLNPATEAVLAEVADGTEADGLAAVEAASAALPSWAATAPRERSEILHRAFERMLAEQAPLARLMVLENGKALRDAMAEVAYAAEFFRWFAEEAVRARGELLRAPGGRGDILVVQEPVGVSLLVTPWNFPAAMATRKLAPALAAGCTAVLKPASETPLTALAIARILEESGAPPGVVNVVTTQRSGPVVAAMLGAAPVRKLSFTGSTEVGRILLAQAAKRVVNCSMELGGDAPLIVCDDADLELAVEGALLAKMRNGGQACTAANRIYVQSGLYEPFLERFSARMQGLKLGDGLEADVELGPLINRKAQASMAEVVRDARQRGATLVSGGGTPERRGFFFQPTVLASSDGAELVDHEVFGPVAPVMRFSEIEEAIRRANAVDYGLVAYVFTQDLQRGLQICRGLETGMVALNRGMISDPAAPFGGVKQSGLGREGGRLGLEAFLEPKYIAAQLWESLPSAFSTKV